MQRSIIMALIFFNGVLEVNGGGGGEGGEREKCH